MLTDKQSLLLCGLLTGGIFVAGVLDILTNFVVLTILSIIFIAIIANIVSSKLLSKDKKNELEEASETSTQNVEENS